MERNGRVRSSKKTKPVRAIGFVCECGNFWRDNNFYIKIREECPFCDKPRDMGRELTLEFGEE